MEESDDFYVEPDSTTTYKASCDYPGCDESATSHHDMTLQLRQSWIGGRVKMGIHIFACANHAKAAEQFVALILER